MADQGHLAPPHQDPSKENIWTETKKRLERFLPDLFEEVFPDVPAPKENPPVTSPKSDSPPPHSIVPTSEHTTDEKENQALVPETSKAEGQDTPERE
jgi:brefeldin A-resistance guanine nucleotide exchange factor 1